MIGRQQKEKKRGIAESYRSIECKENKTNGMFLLNKDLLNVNLRCLAPKSKAIASIWGNQRSIRRYIIGLSLAIVQMILLIFYVIH